MPQQRTAERPAEPHGEPSAGIPTAVAAPSPAYLALAELGRRETRLALSAADRATLEPLAAAWFARGVSADYLTAALTAGLPERIGSPIGLVRRRHRQDASPAAHSTRTGPGTARHSRARSPGRVHRMRSPRPGRSAPGRPLPPLRGHAPVGGIVRGPVPAEIERDVPALVAGLRNLMRTP